jgi:sarcosine oxidase subunit gamma
VDELTATSAFGGLDLPIRTGVAVLSALTPVPRWSLAPFRGRTGAVAQALGGLPEPGTVRHLPEGGRVLWAGLDLWLVEGPLAPTLTPGDAAVTDQSDAWTGLRLEGAASRAVLARLLPVDLDPSVLPGDRSLRSLLHHTPCLLVTAAGGFDLLVPRSYTRTAVHDLATAMTSVAAIDALSSGY